MSQEIKIIDGKKRCGCCGEVKPVSEFHKCASKKSGLKSACKLCRSKQAVKGTDLRRASQMCNLYGITIDIYNQLFVEQSGCCAICGKHQTKLSKRLCVDHNHKIREVRGLLCETCNVGIGMLGADEGTELLNKAIKYLS